MGTDVTMGFGRKFGVGPGIVYFEIIPWIEAGDISFEKKFSTRVDNFDFGVLKAEVTTRP